MLLDRHREALAGLDRAIATLPAESPTSQPTADELQVLRSYALTLRGRTKVALGDQAGALSDFDTAFGLAPFDTRIRLERGELLLSMGDEARARADLEAAAQRGLPTAWRGLCQLALKAFKEQPPTATPPTPQPGVPFQLPPWQRAQMPCQQWANSAGAEPTASVTVGKLWLRSPAPNAAAVQQGARQAMTAFERALKVTPGDPDALFGRGIALLREGDAAAGERDIAAALRSDRAVERRYAADGIDLAAARAISVQATVAATRARDATAAIDRVRSGCLAEPTRRCVLALARLRADIAGAQTTDPSMRDQAGGLYLSIPAAQAEAGLGADFAETLTRFPAEDPTGARAVDRVILEAAMGRFDAARAALSLVTESAVRPRALIALAKAKDKAGRSREAEADFVAAAEAAKAIDSARFGTPEAMRAIWLHNAAVAQAESGRLEGATATADGIADPFWRAQARASIAIALDGANRRDAAQAMLALARADVDTAVARPPDASVGPWMGVIRAQAKLGADGTARADVERLPAGPWRVNALVAIGEEQARRRLDEAARATFADAEAAIAALPQPQRGSALAGLAATLARMDRLDEAVALVPRIDGYVRETAVVAIVTRQAEQGRVEAAEATVALITNPNQRARAWAAIAGALQQRGDDARARMMAVRAIEAAESATTPPSLPVYALVQLSRALMR